MTVHLVRHGAAGNRDGWAGPDWLRPLTSKGRAQARGLLTTLHDMPIRRIVSSPYLRCTETMLPLAGARRVPVEIDDALAEGSDTEAVLALAKQVSEAGGGVLCSHGDVIPAVLEHLRAAGAQIGAGGCEKGAVWTLEVRGGAVRAARYLAPREA